MRSPLPPECTRGEDSGVGGGGGWGYSSPLDLRWGGWSKKKISAGNRGGGVRSDRNLDNNCDSFDKHVSPLIAFSHWLLCFGVILPFFISTLSMFNECLQSCVNFVKMTGNRKTKTKSERVSIFQFAKQKTEKRNQEEGEESSY